MAEEKLKLSADSYKVFIKDNKIQLDDEGEFIYFPDVDKTKTLLLTPKGKKHDNYLPLNSNDDDGYTPLCYGALNNVPAEVLACLINKDAKLDRPCFRGKTPVELACLSMNLNALRVFFGEEYTYVVLNDEGKPEKDNVLVVDEESDTTSEVEVDQTANIKIDNTDKKCARPTQKDFLTACNLAQGGDCVDLLLKADKEKKLYLSCDEENAKKGATRSDKDENRITALELACLSQCYDSVDHILKADRENGYSDGNEICLWKNHLLKDEAKSPGEQFFKLALSLPDIGLAEKFVRHFNILNKNWRDGMSDEFKGEYISQIGYNNNSDELIKAIIDNEMNTLIPSSVTVSSYTLNSDTEIEYNEKITVNTENNIANLIISSDESDKIGNTYLTCDNELSFKLIMLGDLNLNDLIDLIVQADNTNLTFKDNNNNTITFRIKSIDDKNVIKITEYHLCNESNETGKILLLSYDNEHQLNVKFLNELKISSNDAVIKIDEYSGIISESEQEITFSLPGCIFKINELKLKDFTDKFKSSLYEKDDNDISYGAYIDAQNDYNLFASIFLKTNFNTTIGKYDYIDKDDFIEYILNNNLYNSLVYLLKVYFKNFEKCDIINEIKVHIDGLLTDKKLDKFKNFIDCLIENEYYELISYLILERKITNPDVTIQIDEKNSIHVLKYIDELNNEALIDTICNDYVAINFNVPEITESQLSYLYDHDCYNIITALCNRKLLLSKDIEYLAGNDNNKYKSSKYKSLPEYTYTSIYVDNNYYEVIAKVLETDRAIKFSINDFAKFSAITDENIITKFVNNFRNSQNQSTLLSSYVIADCNNILSAILESNNITNKDEIIEKLLESENDKAIKLALKYKSNAIDVLLKDEKYSIITTILYNNLLDDDYFRTVCDLATSKYSLQTALIKQYDPDNHTEIFNKLVDNGVYAIVYLLWNNDKLSDENVEYINENNFFDDNYAIPLIKYNSNNDDCKRSISYYVNNKLYNIIKQLFIRDKLAVTEYVSTIDDAYIDDELFAVITDNFNIDNKYSANLLSKILG